ncbi:MAG: YgfZ/GcvT domain-containing protein [Beijerinckiaceae bacterium]
MLQTRKAVGLPNRGVLRITGEDARSFLDGLVTNSLAGVKPDVACHTALLTPQGKIIADFFVTEADAEDGGGFYCDVPLVSIADLMKRLTLYKLRAKVTIEDMSSELVVMAIWGGEPVADLAMSFTDPRLAAMGQRVIVHHSQQENVIEAAEALTAELEHYHNARARLCLGEPVFDYPLNDTFPHEINMDQLHGIDFQKGCYVGQEVVSRMQHRGSARTRLVQLQYEEHIAVAEGAPVVEGDKTLGVTGTCAAGIGLAMLRLDRAADAVAAGTPITAGGVPATVVKPAWWTASWPLPEA